MAYFPLFVELEDAPCLIVGGGMVALRKAEKLLEFGGKVSLVAPQIHPKLQTLAREKSKLTLFPRSFCEEDLDGVELVIAATDDAMENHQISLLCKQRRIPVNAVDRKEDCTFILPSIVRQQNLVAAFSSGGKSPLLTQYLKEKEQDILTPKLGEINELLGAAREPVLSLYEEEAKKKAAFRSLLAYCMEQEELPDREAFLNRMRELLPK